MSIKAAIVEDDAQTRAILAAWVAEAPEFALVGEWGEAETAVPSLKKLKPDVVLMDINLPHQSGIEAVKALKPLLPETQFVILTVYQDADHIFDALASGASGYLLKRTPREELLCALQDVHQGGSPMTSSIARKVVQCFSKRAHPLPQGQDLSKREQEVLDLLARGYFIRDVAVRLNLSLGSVKTYVRRIYEKLHVRSRTEAVAKYVHLAHP
jgi:DNA-binding NarL/FixJ family response regulator